MTQTPTTDPAPDVIPVVEHPNVTVVNLGADENGAHRATVRGHGMTIKMKLRGDTPALSGTAAAELAAGWAAMLVELTGGDPHG